MQDYRERALEKNKRGWLDVADMKKNGDVDVVVIEWREFDDEHVQAFGSIEGSNNEPVPVLITEAAKPFAEWTHANLNALQAFLDTQNHDIHPSYDFHYKVVARITSYNLRVTKYVVRMTKRFIHKSTRV